MREVLKKRANGIQLLPKERTSAVGLVVGEANPGWCSEDQGVDGERGSLLPSLRLAGSFRQSRPALRRAPPRILEQRGGVGAGVRDVCQPSPTTPVPRNPCHGQAAWLGSSSLANFWVLAAVTPRLDSTLPEGKLGPGLIHFFLAQ